MKLPSEIRQWLVKRHATRCRQWLAADDDAWPLRIPLGLPTEAAALRQPEAVRAWADSWRGWRGPGALQWVERRWTILGSQQLPQTLALANAAEVASWIGELERWQRAVHRRDELTARWPALAPLTPRLFDTLTEYSDDDFLRLQALLAWLSAHPACGLYPRQLPLAGIDSKWLEPRIALVASMLAALRGNEADADAYRLCGLKRPPVTLRLRVLDPALRARLAGLGDFSAPVEMVAALDWRPATVLVVENLQSGLALHDLPGAVAIIGLGYAVDLLASLPWCQDAVCLYWGDIDTHGYAILHRARNALPHLRSVMMDQATLHAHRALWSHEKAPCAATSLPALTAAEHAVYDALRSNLWAQGVRLEQERIAWDQAWARLRACSADAD